MTCKRPQGLELDCYTTTGSTSLNERICAALALLLTAHHESLAYGIDFKPLPACAFKRHRRPRAMTEATVGFSTLGPVYDFKFHALMTPEGLIVKFAINPAPEADVSVARALLPGQSQRLQPTTLDLTARHYAQNHRVGLLLPDPHQVPCPWSAQLISLAPCSCLPQNRCL